jgi:hypothetical protein
MSGSGSARSIDADLVPAVPATIASVEVDGEAVVYDERRQSVHVLNPTAMLVWTGIDGRTSLGQIAEELASLFGADLDAVRSDVLELAEDLMNRELISAPGRSPEGPREEPSARGPRFLEDPPGG